MQMRRPWGASIPLVLCAACALDSASEAPARRASAALAATPAGSVDLRPNGIYVDGHARLLRGGTIQWFRMPREEWEDRILRFKAAGYNTIDMYVAWRNHEPREGQFDFETYDIRAFLDLAQKHGLYVYFRPGPYITDEMDGGGVPSWVFNRTSKRTRDPDVADGTINLRTNDRDYLDVVSRYFARLNEVIRPYLHTNGGPIVLYGVENEYNWFTTAFDLDKLAVLDGARERDPKQIPDVAGYLGRLRDVVRSQGVDVPVTTCPGDGTTSGMDGVAGIVPMPNVYSGLDTSEYVAWSLLRDMHDPAKNGGSYTGFPSGVTETDRQASVLRRFVLGGMDAIFQFNAVGMHQEGRQNAVVLNGGPTSSLADVIATIKKVTDVRLGTAGTAFVRPPVGYFPGVVDYNGAITPSGLLRSKFYAIRRTNLFVDSFEEQIAAAGLPARSSTKAITGLDTRVTVANDALGVVDPDGKTAVHYWLPLGGDAAIVGLRNPGQAPIVAGKNVVRAFGDSFPRYADLTVPVEASEDVASGASREREYVMLLPVRLPLGDTLRIRYSTSEVLSVRDADAERVVYLYGAEGTDGELALDGNGVARVDAAPSVAVRESGPGALVVTYRHGAPAALRVRDASGRTTRIVILTTEQAGRTWFVPSAAGEAALIGPAYVETTPRGTRVELDPSPAGSLVHVASGAPVAIDGWCAAGPYDPSTSLTPFRTARTDLAPSFRLDLAAGRARSDRAEADEEADANGWIALGDAPSPLEPFGLASGHAWYRADVELSEEEAERPAPLFIEHVSDLAGIYVNGRYLLTVSPLGTAIDSASGDVDYGFRIPQGVLRAGTNTIAIRNEVWGHGSFMFPRGQIEYVPVPFIGDVWVPGLHVSAPALGFDALKGVYGSARLGKKPLRHWSLRGELGGERGGYASPDLDDAGWSAQTIPTTLAPGDVRWYRATFRGDQLPDAASWNAPLVVTLAGRSAKADVYLNGRLIGRWLSDDTWLRRGSWVQPQREMWTNVSVDDFPLARDAVLPGDNVLTLAIEETSDQTGGGERGHLDAVALRMAREIEVDEGAGATPVERPLARATIAVRPAGAR